MKLRRIQFAAVAGSLASFAAMAHAQTEGADVLPQQPNVLLLVDTSGSMEWKSSGDVSPVCDPTNPNTTTTTPNEKSRWIELVETLTGTVDDYSCYAERRDSTTNFSQEFELSPTDPPYDLGYTDAYHRPMSGLCAPGPGVLPPVSTPYAYPVGAITYRPYQGGAINLNPGSSCAFSQQRDGLLDAFDGLLRFGLMTFDTHPDPGTGVVSGIATYPNGKRGTWSYYLSSPSRCKRVGGSTECVSGATPDPVGCCVGTPWDCNIPSAFEVGARNAAAPPWEGRMVAFGPSIENGTTRNQWIQEILLTTRPYGATPIAGMLDDARNFIWHDDTPDPLNTGSFFGPARDPLVTATCRPNYVILLTDGEPNTDLRPSCENGGASANCPYDRAEEIANDLATSTVNPPVRTFVVGFALSTVNPSASGTPIDCATMDLSICTSPTATADAALHACCTMNNIAYNGTPVALRGKPAAGPGLPLEDHAMFPKNPTELRTSLSRVFQNLLKQVTGRTSPISSPVAATDKSGAAGYEFTSGAKVLPTGLWGGVLNRQRITCGSDLASTVQPVDVSKGDDFVANLNKDPTATDRLIFSVQPDVVGSGSARHATWSMRPYLEGGVTDGVGHYKGTQTGYDAPANLANEIAPEAMNITTSTCGVGVPVNTCRTQLVDWHVGLPNAKPVSRCPHVGAADCSIIGDIFHSLPQLRNGQPNDSLQDDAYLIYSSDNAKRDTVLYTSSNDGFLHAFRVAPGDSNDTNRQVNTNKNNENWSFIPPAVLPQIQAMYPGTGAPTLNRIPALDGVPVIKDVAVTVGGNRQLSSNYPYRFERKRAADGTTNEKHGFRTILVQGYGAKFGGYYAVDITSPTVDTANPTTTGPKFLWQLSTDDAGNQLFGKGSATPLITTLYMDTKQSTEPIREVAVAVLPGGLGDAPTSTGATCNTADKTTAIPGTTAGSTGSPTSSAFRSNIRCYGANGSSVNSLAARSLTIVKLDTGEVIRTFRPFGVTQPVTFPTGAATNVTNTTLDSNGTVRNLDIGAPIVGQPVAYPAGTGRVADRIFVGDAEGRIWRIDVAKPNPADWTMNVFFDPYDDTVHPLGQPIQTPPVLSVDGRGRITINFSTGDQDNLTPDPVPTSPVTFNYVVSLTETTEPVMGVPKFQSQLNWYQTYMGGKRVLGPMTLFNKTLYFSTFLQSITSACNDIGTSSVVGLDYIQAVTPGTPVSGGKINFPQIDYANAVISGVGLRQRPSCSTAATSANSGLADAFLGYGNVSSVQTTNVGQFELVMQLGGRKNGGSGSGSGSDGSSNKPATDTKAVASVNPPVRISSWAPIIE
jgi:type IV pilus assembly protein PilY1